MNKLSGMCLALLAAFFWSAALVLSKYALSEMNSRGLFLIQVAAAATAAWAVLLFRREKPAADKTSLLAYSAGLLEPFLAYMLSLYGLAFVPAGTASVVYSAETVLIILLSAALLKNKIQSPALLAVLVLAAGGGSVLAVYSPAADSPETAGRETAGHLLIFAGVFFAALYVVISAKLVENRRPSVLLAGQLLVCAAVSVVFVLPFAAFNGTGAFVLLLAAVSGVLQYYLAFYCYLFSLKRITVQTAGAALYLIPVFSIGLAAVFLGESITARQAAGVAITIASLLCLNYFYEGRGEKTHPLR